MITQAQIIDQGHKLGFEDVGFTSARMSAPATSPGWPNSCRPMNG